jgi:hypothetical protein
MVKINLLNIKLSYESFLGHHGVNVVIIFQKVVIHEIHVLVVSSLFFLINKNNYYIFKKKFFMVWLLFVHEIGMKIGHV